MTTYTVEEANRALPRVRELVARMVQVVRALPDLQDEVRIAEYQSRRSAAAEEDTVRLRARQSALRSSEREIRETIEALEAMGIQVKDPRAGLVDFPAYREGELVELCWQLGEESVSHWHRVGEGFPGRQPI